MKSRRDSFQDLPKAGKKMGKEVRDPRSDIPTNFYYPRKGGHCMHFKKIFIFVALCLAIGFLGCSKEEKKVEGPKQERITKNLAPQKSELKGQNFFVELSDLKVLTVVDTASKEIVETPILRANIKITNKSKDILDIQAVTFEYLDEAGKPIPFKPEEKIDKVYPFWKALQPEGTTEGNFDVTIPKMAVTGKALGKIQIDLVYVPSPLKRETLILTEKVE
jgi:hypothetical protein